MRALEERVDELREVAAGRERELDLLGFELEEIERVSPSEAEAADLTEERERLRHLETLAGRRRRRSRGAVGGRRGGGARRASGARGRAGAAGGRHRPAARRPVRARGRARATRPRTSGAALRSYADGLEGSPGRLEEVEERLALFARLERKHGGGVAEVLAHAERCRARREELERAEVSLGTADEELAAARDELEGLAAGLSKRRAARGACAGRRGARAAGRAGHARGDVLGRVRRRGRAGAGRAGPTRSS